MSSFTGLCTSKFFKNSLWIKNIVISHSLCTESMEVFCVNLCIENKKNLLNAFVYNQMIGKFFSIQ